MAGYQSMFIRIISQLLVISVLFPAISYAAKVESMVICKNRSQVRTVRIEGADGGFSTYYVKFGKENRVGSGQNLESQVSILENIKGNLEGAGWQCRDVEKARLLEV